jgi:glycosylphosphatidylinositol transamidase (GPIT) subunit GPI8
LQGIPTNSGSQKVVNSGPNDNIFVYFSGRGAAGSIAFPEGDVVRSNTRYRNLFLIILNCNLIKIINFFNQLTATDLNKAIKSMHANKKYKNVGYLILN